MKRFLSCLAAAGLVVAAVPGAGAGPTAGGIASDDVEYVTYVPFEVGTATGADIFGKYMIVTSWRSFSIYDISNPESPQLLGRPVPFGFKFENENVSTNGKIMLFSEELPQDILHVWDIEDKTNPVEIATLAGAGGHTNTCILKCKYTMSSEGVVTDLREPSNPKMLDLNWMEATGVQGGIHDVEEFKNGFVITSPISHPLQLLDVRNPAKPKVLAVGENPNPTGFLLHSGRWPNQGKDKFLLMQGEKNVRTRCNDTTGPFLTYDATTWKKSKTFKVIDQYHAQNGTVTDGNPPANALGCSAHWFQEHPKFNNGGLVAMGFYEHGTKFFDVDSKGMITEVGWFVPYAGSTSAAYWVNDEIVYAVDYTRGIDVLRWNGKA